MANTRLEFFLLHVCILATQMTRGVDGQCLTPPINQAVYEGTQNTTITCSSSPSKVSYVLKAAIDELNTYRITNYDDSVSASLRSLFDVNPTGLVIKIAQGTAAVSPTSTAGLYIAYYPNSTNKVGAKLVVVSQGPTCGCIAINSTAIQLSCSVTYGDSSFNPINAKMTWTSDGNFYANDTPARKRVNPYVVSVSTMIVRASNQAAFRCKVTFAKPTNIQFSFVAQNAPEFSASCTSLCPCRAPLSNIAVHEGATNTSVYYPASRNGVKWTTIATTDELTAVDIVNYGDAVHPACAEDYAFDALGLTILNATIAIERGHQLSTAGLYTAECNGNQVSFKLLIVRQGPMCSKKLSPDSSTVEVICSTVYADSTYDPIAAIFTFYVDGNLTAVDTPQRIIYDAYTYISTSTFTAAYMNSSVYQCVQTFGQPTEVQDPIVAMNAPTFTQNCTV